jgi:uncharacterized protein YbcV (DUF1398 family)
MNAEQAEVMKACCAASLSGALTFPEIVGRLDAVGVERYHADYSRGEITYYLPDGDSLVIPSPHPKQVTGGKFSVAAVEAAVRLSQRNEHSYPDFVQKTMAAGCVGYFVQITGRQAIYFGRNGETHVERFPPAPEAQQ